MFEKLLSIVTTNIWTFLLANSSKYVDRAIRDEVDVEAKFPGSLIITTHFPLYCDNVTIPSVESAVKSGAILPIVKQEFLSFPLTLIIS